MKNKTIKQLMVIAASFGAFAIPAHAVSTADIVFVVDESGSMAGEHTWIGNMVSSLDAELGAAGVTGNRYALIGFGASNAGGHSVAGHVHSVGGGTWGNAGQLSTAAGGLVITGGTEDGYSGINTALGLGFRPEAAVNVILITDEDRDILGGAPNKSGILAGLQGFNALLNVVVDARFTSNALGIDSEDNYYLADGAGGYTTGNPGAAISGAGTTINDYVDLALQTGGAAWTLSQLRAGGLTAASFTDAFVDIKVQEIIVQPPSATPDGGATAVLLAFGFSGFALLRRKLA